VTILAARFAWRGWRRSCGERCTGDGAREFQPLVRDVRALAERLARERRRRGAWRQLEPRAASGTLTQHLHGERVVILANREPYIHERSAKGVEVLHPASGLVTALEPVMRACSGVWVAHGSGSRRPRDGRRARPREGAPG
jgi:trehalose 6-phosphate synthase